MSDLSIIINEHNKIWRWELVDGGPHALASGSSPDYDEACRCARIAWEQHGKEGE